LSGLAPEGGPIEITPSAKLEVKQHSERGEHQPVNDEALFIHESSLAYHACGDRLPVGQMD
jgi:hypothetical protein